MKGKIIKYLVFAFVAFAWLTPYNLVAAIPEPPYNTHGVELKWDFSKSNYLVSNSALLNISGVNTGDTFVAYKVLDASYVSSSNTISYEFTAAFSSFLTSSSVYNSLTIEDYMNLTSGDITSGSTMTSSTLDKLASLYATYIRNNSVIGTTMTTTGNTASTTLAAGTYLILPKTSSKVYAVMVGNLQMEGTTDNEWTLNDTSIVAKASDVSINKYVEDIDNTTSSFKIDDTYKYYLVGTVPTYPTNSINRVYTITDTLGTGISLSGISSFIIKDGETTLTTNSDGTVVNSSGNTVATISISAQTVTITFDVNYITTNKVTVMYDAKLNSSAVLGDTGNINSAVLTYSNDPYGTGTTTVTSSTTVYTYGLELFAYKSGTSTGISNMTFDVYTDSSLSEKVGTITTDSTGKGSLVGVAEGTYYLKNTKTASGYSLAATTSMKVKSTGAVSGSNDGYYKVEIPVNSSGILPFTGGTGTIIYTIFGLIIIMSGVAGYVLYKKKNKDNDKK